MRWLWQTPCHSRRQGEKLHRAPPNLHWLGKVQRPRAATQFNAKYSLRIVWSMKTKVLCLMCSKLAGQPMFELNLKRNQIFSPSRHYPKVHLPIQQVIWFLSSQLSSCLTLHFSAPQTASAPTSDCLHKIFETLKPIWSWLLAANLGSKVHLLLFIPGFVCSDLISSKILLNYGSTGPFCH